tara:strand:+ start:244 stop:909 length:666 start_codon:yes stop_codon:yes gene_type:complete
MNSKLISTLTIMFLMNIPYASLAHDIPKPTFTIGAMQITDNALDVLTGPGVKIDDSYTVANLTVSYYVSPSLAFESGVITSPEFSASLPNNDSGALHGKSYSASGALTITAKTDTSYLFGLKYSPSTNDTLDIYGKAGLLFWATNFIVSGSGTLTYNDSAYYSKTFLQVDGSDPYIGLGLSYKISKNTSFTFDYISTAATSDQGGVAIDLSGYSLSWTRNF